MITIHELGHYLAAKATGVRVTEFSIGFGKALYKRTSKKTGEVFAIRMIPLGGYCAFADEDDAGSGFTKVGAKGQTLLGLDAQKESPSERVRYIPTSSENFVFKSNMSTEGKKKRKLQTFPESQPWKRLIILFSGAFFNFVSAIIFSVILLMITGYAQGVMIRDLSQNEPVTVSGEMAIERYDIILAVDGEQFTLMRGLASVMGQFSPGDTVTLRILRPDGSIREGYSVGEGWDTRIILQNMDGRAGIGVRLDTASIEFLPMRFFPAIGQAVIFSFELAWMILVFLWMLVSGQLGLTGIGGPISTVSVMAASVSSDFINLFILLPLISVNLAVFNLLPFPALDGARMVFTGIEWGRGKPIDPEIEGRIHMVGLLFLMGFVLLADMNFLFGGRSMLELLSQWRL